MSSKRYKIPVSHFAKSQSPPKLQQREDKKEPVGIFMEVKSDHSTVLKQCTVSALLSAAKRPIMR